MLKKLAAVVLSVVLVLGYADVFAARRFNDVATEDWFYEQVNRVLELGLMRGTSEVDFSPNEPVTRAMAVQVLYNHAGSPRVGGWPYIFNDVSQDEWFHDAIVWAGFLGIARDTGQGGFSPNEYVTRSDFLMMLDGFANYYGVELPELRPSQAFVDDTDIRSYAREAIDRFYRAMIINGRPDGRFDPDGNMTRAELATMLTGFVVYSENVLNYFRDDFPVPPYGYMPLPEPMYGIPPHGEIVPEYGFPYYVPEYGFPYDPYEEYNFPDYGYPYDEDYAVPVYGCCDECD